MEKAEGGIVATMRDPSVCLHANVLADSEVTIPVVEERL
jgi:hypothetical protein